MSETKPLTMSAEQEHRIRVQYDLHEQPDRRTCGVCALLAEIDALRAALAEAQRERDEWLVEGSTHCCHDGKVRPWPTVVCSLCGPRWHTSTASALAAAQLNARTLREALADFGEHGRDCPWAHFSAGRPKEGGGYEMLYRGTWYEVKPEDKRPACTCGFAAALSAPADEAALRQWGIALVRETIRLRVVCMDEHRNQMSAEAIVNAALGAPEAHAKEG